MHCHFQNSLDLGEERTLSTKMRWGNTQEMQIETSMGKNQVAWWRTDGVGLGGQWRRCTRWRRCGDRRWPCAAALRGGDARGARARLRAGWDPAAWLAMRRRNPTASGGLTPRAWMRRWGGRGPWELHQGLEQ
ncbi:Os05g0584975 [Oryza sativa Japonica Group]|uniref:Os05g0584975 protein n=1 Tax=Oryza sativa subsp. japonica TaxID=39947 RepID=A0A0P0WR03_ORYSJ|nr:Os05g0584975 [Oryza sativa Japonica Group]